QSLKYLQAKSDSFGGNLTLQNRLSYFGDRDLYPCGFFQQFPIHRSDGMAMERCGGLVVASAIFGDHDKIRQPMGLGSKTLDLVCFVMFVDDATLTRLHLLLNSPNQRPRIGAWNLVRVPTQSLYGDPAMNGVIPKYLIHRLFPNAKHSIWIDAKMQLAVDPLLLVHALVVKEGVDMAVSRHPFFLHTLEEAMATARWKKWWDIEGLRIQMETYCENGLQPWHSSKSFPTDVPDSAVILRKHSSGSNKFSCLVFNELEAFNPRDQLAFAFVRDKMTPRIRVNMFEVQVFERIAVEYRHNMNHNHSVQKQQQ
ncbi:hypothetical protein M569_16730, partial [Genlisea aurea]